ncbi:MAG: hypothetical protein MJ107_00215 [Lachnospiraceae bacterium]|nr:hypothetical protein [Lachnospiraceae bacterium]
MTIIAFSLILTYMSMIAVDLLVAVRIYRTRFGINAIVDICIHIILMVEAVLYKAALSTGRVLSVETANENGIMFGIKTLGILIPLIAFLYGVSELIFEYYLRIRTINAASISRAFEQLDCGILFTEADGSRVLTNRAMKQISVALFGINRTFQKNFWEQLENYKSENVQKVEFAGEMAFILENGTIYSIHRTLLEDKKRQYYEITAQDITKIYLRSLELKNKIEALGALEGRLAKTLENVADIQQERELLSYKYHIHDELGNAILRGRRLSKQNSISPVERAEYTENWKRIYKLFRSSSNQGFATGTDFYMDIVKTAAAIGCNLLIAGERPRNSEVLALTIREAVYNAVKHSHANVVMVNGKIEGDRYRIEISDNGSDKPTDIVEGGGLTNMRKAIENAGGSLTIDITDGVHLSVILPKNEEY